MVMGLKITLYDRKMGCVCWSARLEWAVGMYQDMFYK